MKIRTLKYEIYVDGGQIYTLDGKYIRPIDQKQIDFLRENKFKTKTEKKNLDFLIDNDFKDFEVIQSGGMSLEEARKRMGLTYVETVCPHKYFLVEINETEYIFACGKCLFIQRKLK